MKFKEKYRQEGQTLYVPEEFSAHAIEGPSEIFLNTLKSMKELGFSEKSELEVADFLEKCRGVFASLKR